MCQKFYDFEKLNVFSKNEFLIHRKSKHKDEIYTYEEIIKVSKELSDVFLNYGLKNTRVSIQSPHSPDLCVVLLSILNCECSFCPVSHNASDEELCQAMEAFNSPFLITAFAQKHAHLETLVSRVILNNEFHICKLLSKEKDFPKPKLLDECYCIKTSGSTGAPKIVQVPYECIEPNITSLSTLLELSSRHLIWMLSPITFDPFVVEFFLALKNGCSILITKHGIPEVDAEIMQPKHFRGPSLVQVTPSVFRLFGLKGIQNKVLHGNTSIRILLLGGERFPSVKELSNWTATNNNKTRVFNIYGITEVSCWSTLYEFKNTEEEDVPIGLPLDVETHVRLVNDSSEPINEGLGLIEIGSRTRKCTVDNDIQSDTNSNEILFRSTGDIGLIRDGKIYYLGRQTEMVKRYGNRVHLNEVERKISEIEGVLGVCCIFNEKNSILTCFIIKENDTPKKTIQRCILTKLVPSEKPDKIQFVDSFPLTSHGKISKSKLLKLPDEDSACTSVKGIFERFLADILCVDLNQSKPTEMPAPSKIRKHSLDLSFLDAGGTSFQALTLFAQCEQVLNRLDAKLLELMLNGTASLSFILEYIGTLESSVYTESDACEEKPKNILKELLNVKWRYDTGKCVDSSPSCCSNIVCVGSHSHRLITLNCKSGEEVSTCILPDRIECQATFVNESLILVGCYDGFLYAIDCVSGQIQWKLDCEGMIKAKPLLNGNLLVIGSYSKQFNLRCFDLNQKHVLWKASLGSRGIFSSPLLINTESFVVCCLDGCVARVNFNTGNIAWRTKFQSPVFSTPALYGETQVLIAEVSGVLHCLDLKCGTEVWNFKRNGNIFSSIVSQKRADKNYIIFGNHDCKVYCLMSGQPNQQPLTSWKNTLNSAVYSTPVIFDLSTKDPAVLSCSTKGRIYVFDFFGGSTLFTLDLDNEVYSSPCIYENRIYIGCRNNDLICLEIQSKGQ